LSLPIGVLGASMGSGAALIAAAGRRPDESQSAKLIAIT
jgi:hypothetical protein